MMFVAGFKRVCPVPLHFLLRIFKSMGSKSTLLTLFPTLNYVGFHSLVGFVGCGDEARAGDTALKRPLAYITTIVRLLYLSISILCFFTLISEAKTVLCYFYYTTYM